MNQNLELLKIRLLDLNNVDSEDMMFRRINGLDWPVNAYTMIGIRRLDNLEYCLNKIVEEKIEGDLIETGVWKGGACIFMAAALKELKEERNVFVADAFDETFPIALNSQDEWAQKHDFSQLKVSLEDVQSNFAKFNLLNDNIKFLRGWFSDTLPKAPIEKLSLMRLDGDMYSSTMDALINLYDKLSVGGFCILDDWAIDSSKNAVLDFFKERKIKKEIISIDSLAVYFRK